MTGFLNLLKPPGMSSHDMISAARRILGVKRIGHAGTLDPAAAGVLPVAVGQAARLLEYLELADKSYRAEALFGAMTDSGDDTGAILARGEDGVPEEEQILAALASLTGEIEQMPPAHSAVKINGERAYDLVRRGEQVELPSRRVRIEAIRLVCRREHSIVIDVDCSKGTYIRSLIVTLGERLKVPATMGFLLRTRVGDFRLGDAMTLEELAARGGAGLLPPETMLSHMRRYDLRASRRKAFCNGLSTGVRDMEGEGDCCVFSEGAFLGIGRYSGKSGELTPVKVIQQEAGA